MVLSAGVFIVVSDHGLILVPTFWIFSCRFAGWEFVIGMVVSDGGSRLGPICREKRLSDVGRSSILTRAAFVVLWFAALIGCTYLLMWRDIAIVTEFPRLGNGIRKQRHGNGQDLSCGERESFFRGTTSLVAPTRLLHHPRLVSFSHSPPPLYYHAEIMHPPVLLYFFCKLARDSAEVSGTTAAEHKRKEKRKQRARWLPDVPMRGLGATFKWDKTMTFIPFEGGAEISHLKGNGIRKQRHASSHVWGGTEYVRDFPRLGNGNGRGIVR